MTDKTPLSKKASENAENTGSTYKTLGDFVEYAAHAFAESDLAFGHGTDNALDEAALLDFAKAHKYEESIAALAAMARIPIAMTDGLFTAEQAAVHADPILVVPPGAAAGYLSLWSVYWGFKLATGKEGMGYGDFKLFAALGAWFGWQALVPIILMASVIGAIVGIAMKLTSGLREGGYVPFGPFLAGAGLTALVFGPQAVMQQFLGWLGL